MFWGNWWLRIVREEQGAGLADHNCCIVVVVVVVVVVGVAG